MINKVNLERDKILILAHVESMLNQMIIQQESRKELGLDFLCTSVNVKICADCPDNTCRIMSETNVTMPGIGIVVETKDKNVI